LALVEGTFLRFSSSPHPSYPRPVIRFLEDILPEEIEYWECGEDELLRAEVYISAMESDEVEFKRGKFIVKELSVLEQVPQEDEESANVLFGMPIEILLPDTPARVPAPRSPAQGTPDQPAMKSSPKKSPLPTPTRATRSRSSVVSIQQQLEDEIASSSPTTKRQKLDRST